MATQLAAAASRLAESGIPTPLIDAELLLAHVLGERRGRVQALSMMDAALTPQQEHEFAGLVARRALREPLQHITGRAPFRYLELHVGLGVFVPRPETECLVDAALDLLRPAEAEPHPAQPADPAEPAEPAESAHPAQPAHPAHPAHPAQPADPAEPAEPADPAEPAESADPAHPADPAQPPHPASPPPLVVDLGSGSGAIALAIATEAPHTRVIAVEKSADALPFTRRNIAAFGQGRVQLIAEDLAVALDHLHAEVAVLVSNPPYIPDAAVPRDPEVRLFDPALALYGGEDGLDVVRTISRVGLRVVRPDGWLLLEHGELQGGQIRELLTADGWHCAQTLTDLTGRDRITRARRSA